MQKAKYMERQPEVRWQPVNNGMVDVTLCLNEQKVTIEQGQMEDSAKQMMYEYDYHQFRESADKINEETVRASPVSISFDAFNSSNCSSKLFSTSGT